jgi:hypothetical protein
VLDVLLKEKKMNSMYDVSKIRFSWRVRAAVVLAVTMALWQNATEAALTAGMGIVAPNTGHMMLVFGYNDGTLEFRDWQGTLLQTRSGFGEVTVVQTTRLGNSPLPRLLVGSTDTGGALRVIDPTNINNDLAVRFGFIRITALWGGGDHLYVGSTDLGGTLRTLNSTTLADEKVRCGFVEVTAIWDAWDTTNGRYMLVGSTDAGGAMRCLNWGTLADITSPRYGFGRIFAFDADDVDYDGNAEIVIASGDGGGAVRFIEAPNFTTDLEARYGFGTTYGVSYGPVGITQCDNEGQAGSKVSIVVAPSDTIGAVRIIEVDANTLAVSAGYLATRYGFGTVGVIALPDIYQIGVHLVAVLSSDGGTCAAHIMDENLTDLSSFFVP